MNKFVRLMLFGLTVSVLFYGCIKDEANDGNKCQPYTLQLPEYPYVENELMEKSQEFLDALATQYACQHKGEELNTNNFLFRYAPLTLFNRITNGDTTDIKKAMWVLHLSGWFGGIWLVKGLGSFGRHGTDGDEESAESTADEETYDGGIPETVEIAKRAFDAAAGPEDDLFDFNKESLTVFIIPDYGIASNFGYNKGYLLEIYENPPDGIVAPEGLISCNGPLWCNYAKVSLPVNTGLKYVSENLDSGAGCWAELGDKVKRNQESGESMGRKVWNSIMDRNQMDQQFYDDLLDVSTSFLEVVEAAGLLSAKGYCERDANSGRMGATIQGGIVIWIGAYMGALMHGNADESELPRLVPVGR